MVDPTVTVAINTPVTWTNGSASPHDVTFDNPAAALAVGTGGAGNIPQHTSGSNRRQFATAGSYPFHCQVHGTPMHGTVIVQ
jgi:plastocyanin